MLMPFPRIAAACALALAAGSAAAAPDSAMIDRGRYLVQIVGCNDCHTPNYALSDGKVPEAAWLTGDALGWNGPWGTTYPSNLRLSMTAMSEAAWVKAARHAAYRPPMPSVSLRTMTDRDLRAIYRFVRSLGPAGEAAPAYLPPGTEPQGPAVRFPAPKG